MPSLYRKYRPQTWAELIGQDPIKLTLQKELETSQLAHAYLFSGPRGTGKTTAARLLAKALNCAQRQEDKSEPCNQCPSCEEISRSQSIDVLEIDAASHTGVDNVRENIIDSARFSPTKSRYKIFIIDEVHMLSTSAFNALLKTLEEPPAHVFFILATTEPHKLPSTILSRCQRFDFKKIRLDSIVKHLDFISGNEGFKIETDVLEQVGRLSEGCLRDAQSILEQLFSLGEKKITQKEAGLILPRSNFHQVLELLELMIAKKLKEAILLLNTLVEEGVDLLNFTDDIIQTLHLCLLVKTDQETAKTAFEIDEASMKKINNLVKNVSLNSLVKATELFLKQKTLIRSSPIPQLPLEIALIELCGETDSVADSSCHSDRSADGARSGACLPAGRESLRENKSTLDNKKTETTKEAAAVVDKTEILVQDTEKAVGENPGTLEEIKNKWLLFLKKVQDYNHSLPFILKMGEPTKVCGKKVHINFKFTFHRDKINEPKIRALAEKALNEVMNCNNLCIEGCYSPNLVIQNEQAVGAGNEDLIANLAKSFGGQVVD